MRIQDGKSLFLTKSLPAVDHFQVNFKEIGTLQINLKGKRCCLIFQVYLLWNPCFKHYFPVYPIHSLFQLFDIRISLVISLLFFLSQVFLLLLLFFFFSQIEAVIWIFYSMRLYIVWPMKKNNVTYIQPCRTGGALRNHAKYQFQTCRTSGTQRSKDTNKHLINTEHQYQIFTTSYKTDFVIF